MEGVCCSTLFLLLHHLSFLQSELVDQVSRGAPDRPGACCLSFVSLPIKIGFTVTLTPPLLLLPLLPPPSFLPHFYSPWLLPTPIKHYKHKNPQALKSRPGEELGVEQGGGDGGQQHPPLYTPQSLRLEEERWRGGYIVSDGLAD